MAAPPLDAAVEAEQAFAQALEAIQVEQWAHAELLLERSLMLDPDHAGARLELAGLLASRGRTDAARALIESLIADPRTPEAHRDRLRELLTRTNGVRTNGASNGNSQVPEILGETFVAWARNPLARADLQQLTLTLPEGRVTLPVAQSVHSGALVGLSLRRVVPGGLTLDANVERLFGATAAEAFRVGASGRLDDERPGAPTQTHWSLQTLQAYNGGTRHSAGLSHRTARWRLSGGVFDEPSLTRRGAYLRLEGAAQPRPDFQALLYIDGEYASGGPPSFWRVGAVAAWSPAPRWTVLGHATLHRDFSAYSPWLEDGAARDMRSLNLALERTWGPATGDWRVLARTNVGRRWSNLELFSYRDTGVQLSLQRRWK